MKGDICVELDECALGVHHCGKNAKCVNTPGSFHCECQVGFYENFGQCVEDENECLVGTHRCGDNEVCVNQPGSYDCLCEDGLIKIESQCQKIDSCIQQLMMGRNPCHYKATCVHTGYQFECQCGSGFVGNGNKCTDIDECENGQHNCEGHSTCRNTYGSFICETNCNGKANWATGEWSECSKSCDSGMKHRFVSHRKTLISLL